jgi:hypothetical protein
VLVMAVRRLSVLAGARGAKMQPFAPALEHFCDVSCVEAADDEAWSSVDLGRRMREIGLQLRQGFASEQEQAAVVAELDRGPLKKLKYQKGHWDYVISDYRETERVEWQDPMAAGVVARLKARRCRAVLSDSDILSRPSFPPRGAGGRNTFWTFRRRGRLGRTWTLSRASATWCAASRCSRRA